LEFACERHYFTVKAPQPLQTDWSLQKINDGEPCARPGFAAKDLDNLPTFQVLHWSEQRLMPLDP
jgi:hypothetical protein